MSPNLRTLRKLARAVDLEARIEFVEAMSREERRNLSLHELIAQEAGAGSRRALLA